MSIDNVSSDTGLFSSFNEVNQKLFQVSRG